VKLLRRQVKVLNKNLVRYVNRPAAVVRMPFQQPQLPSPPAAVPVAELPALPEQQEEVAARMMEVEQAPPPANHPQAPIAKLSRCPRTLHDLWREFEFGFAGYKAAKDFTDKERGADKCKYYRRNVFWRKVQELILAGHSADEACDMIYRAYGQSASVTAVIKGMIRDKKTGGHPSLVIRAR
jgi:hypothetical protein